MHTNIPAKPRLTLSVSSNRAGFFDSKKALVKKYEGFVVSGVLIFIKQAAINHQTP
jgi:hypothetical protein